VPLRALGPTTSAVAAVDVRAGKSDQVASGEPKLGRAAVLIRCRPLPRVSRYAGRSSEYEARVQIAWRTRSRTLCHRSRGNRGSRGLPCARGRRYEASRAAVSGGGRSRCRGLWLERDAQRTRRGTSVPKRTFRPCWRNLVPGRRRTEKQERGRRRAPLSRSPPRVALPHRSLPEYVCRWTDHRRPPSSSSPSRAS
jgi:hypothetical protein